MWNWTRSQILLSRRVTKFNVHHCTYRCMLTACTQSAAFTCSRGIRCSHVFTTFNLWIRARPCPSHIHMLPWTFQPPSSRKDRKAILSPTHGFHKSEEFWDLFICETKEFHQCLCLWQPSWSWKHLLQGWQHMNHMLVRACAWLIPCMATGAACWWFNQVQADLNTHDNACKLKKWEFHLFPDEDTNPPVAIEKIQISADFINYIARSLAESRFHTLPMFHL